MALEQACGGSASGVRSLGRQDQRVCLDKGAPMRLASWGRRAVTSQTASRDLRQEISRVSQDLEVPMPVLAYSVLAASCPVRRSSQARESGALAAAVRTPPRSAQMDLSLRSASTARGGGARAGGTASQAPPKGPGRSHGVAFMALEAAARPIPVLLAPMPASSTARC